MQNGQIGALAQLHQRPLLRREGFECCQRVRHVARRVVQLGRVEYVKRGVDDGRRRVLCRIDGSFGTFLACRAHRCCTCAGNNRAHHLHEGEFVARIHVREKSVTIFKTVKKRQPIPVEDVLAQGQRAFFKHEGAGQAVVEAAPRSQQGQVALDKKTEQVAIARALVVRVQRLVSLVGLLHVLPCSLIRLQ